MKLYFSLIILNIFFSISLLFAQNISDNTDLSNEIEQILEQFKNLENNSIFQENQLGQNDLTGFYSNLDDLEKKITNFLEKCETLTSHDACKNDKLLKSRLEKIRNNYILKKQVIDNFVTQKKEIDHLYKNASDKKELCNPSFLENHEKILSYLNPIDPFNKDVILHQKRQTSLKKNYCNWLKKIDENTNSIKKLKEIASVNDVTIWLQNCNTYFNESEDNIPEINQYNHPLKYCAEVSKYIKDNEFKNLYCFAATQYKGFDALKNHHTVLLGKCIDQLNTNLKAIYENNTQTNSEYQAQLDQTKKYLDILKKNYLPKNEEFNHIDNVLNHTIDQNIRLSIISATNLNEFKSIEFNINGKSSKFQTPIESISKISTWTINFLDKIINTILINIETSKYWGYSNTVQTFSCDINAGLFYTSYFDKEITCKDLKQNTLIKIKISMEEKNKQNTIILVSNDRSFIEQLKQIENDDDDDDDENVTVNHDFQLLVDGYQSKPSDDDEIKLHYRQLDINNQNIIFNTYKDQPRTFVLKDLKSDCWIKNIKAMNVGSKAKWKCDNHWYETELLMIKSTK